MIFEYVHYSFWLLHSVVYLQEYIMNRMTGVDAPQGWRAWLMSGPWWHFLLKILIPVFGLLTLICLCIGWILPCIRSMWTKMISDTFVDYVLLQQYELTDMNDMTEACVWMTPALKLSSKRCIAKNILYRNNLEHKNHKTGGNVRVNC